MMMNGNTTPHATAHFLNSAHTHINATQRNATQRKFKFICVIILLFACLLLFSGKPPINAILRPNHPKRQLLTNTVTLVLANLRVLPIFLFL